MVEWERHLRKEIASIESVALVREEGDFDLEIPPTALVGFAEREARVVLL